MTPKFKTPCFVKVTDAEKRREVCQQLQEMGYKNYGNPFQITSATKIFTTIDAEYVPYDVPVDDTWIDCGENIPLFIALSGMREDTDKGQWFISIYGDWLQSQVADFWDSAECGFVENWNKATAEEIVKYFKTK